jgi:ribosomal-protein-alanine N-acetyltransferase
MTQNEQLIFSPLLPAHIDQMEQIEIECFSVPWSREALEEELENPYAHYVVCTDGAGNVLGYIGSRIVLDSADITNVAVRPECRRQGVAARLLQVFLDFAKANKLAFLTLEVRASNYDAIALYGSRGFRSVGRRKNYYEHPREDAIIMTLEFDHGTEDPKP